VGRSVKKGPYVDEKLLKKVTKQKETGIKEPIKTWARACTIIPDFVGHTFMIHNGKIFNKLFVTEDMVGHRLGEFSLTRVFRAHGGVKKKEVKAPGT
jgi:small subunit ribosomal protein S19